MDSSPARRHDKCASGAEIVARGRKNGEAALPNLLVPIDLRDAAPTAPSLFALAESRRVARIAGVTVYAIALAEGELPVETVARLGRAGADKVLVCEGPGLGAPPLDATHGAALLAAVERVSPLLVLFPAGGGGLSLGPSLAAKLGAAFAGPADLEVAETDEMLPDGVGRVFVRFWAAGRATYRRLDPVDVERPVVAILPAHAPGDSPGSPDVDVDVISCGRAAAPGVEQVASEPDRRAAIPLSRALVLVGPDVVPRLGPGFLDQLRTEVPAGVAVADAAQDRAAVTTAAPEILICLGDVGPPPIGTPRSRVAQVLLGDLEPTGRSEADVVWRVPAEIGPGELLGQLIQALRRLAGEPAP